MGIYLVGIYSIQDCILSRCKHIKQYLVLLASVSFASLVNPYFVKGFLEPLNIFKKYGYMLVENQSVFFMQKRAPDFHYFFVEILAILLIVLFISIVLDKKFKIYFSYLIFVLTFMILAFKAIRGIPMFGMFAVPFLAFYTKSFEKKFVVPTLLLVVLTIIPYNLFSFAGEGFGIGLFKDVNASAEFFKQNSLEGPVFNNYDIGGYLIYHLYPYTPVFVDNRPEAYSVDFLQNVYIQAQESEERWQELQETYGFNVIYFYRHDATPWAQPFLIRRIQDEDWIPVFVDDYTLILVKNSERNRGVIGSYALPKNYFVVT